MHCIVVGAGLLGLTSAWFMRREGAEVTVLERASGPGLETSFANGGMLHASQASPWNAPGVLRQALGMLGREDSPLLIRPRVLPRMLPWTWAFFRNARPQRFRANLEKNARLAAYSLAMLDEHFADLGVAYGHAAHGTLKIYRTPEELDTAAAAAERCRDWDVPFSVLDAPGVLRLEPALAPIGEALSGGVHFPGDVSGDAHLFCRELATRAAAAGVRFVYETAVERVVVRNDRLHGVAAGGTTLTADALVIAAGSHSPQLTAPLGLRLPVQPVKGYSITVRLEGWPRVPRVPVIDEHFHAAVCPLGTHLRVAGTAEFAGFDTRLTPARIDNLYALVEHIYPAGAARIARRDSVHWCAFRPMSPDGVGIMGPTAVAGVFVNTGHGHLGWTMAPGAGKLVADQVLGRRTDIACEDYLLARFGH